MRAFATTMGHSDSTKAWYREPMVWLVVAIPASALVMGLIMIVLSVASYDGLVADDYYRRGLEINRVLERDRAAAALGLTGELEVDDEHARIRVELRAEAAFSAPSSLRLRLYHATRAGYDREAELLRTGAMTYAGARPEMTPGRWLLELAGPDWRLTGVLLVPAGRHAAMRHRIDR